MYPKSTNRSQSSDITDFLIDIHKNTKQTQPVRSKIPSVFPPYTRTTFFTKKSELCQQFNKKYKNPISKNMDKPKQSYFGVKNKRILDEILESVMPYDDPYQHQMQIEEKITPNPDNKLTQIEQQVIEEQKVEDPVKDYIEEKDEVEEGDEEESEEEEEEEEQVLKENVNNKKIEVKVEVPEAVIVKEINNEKAPAPKPDLGPEPESGPEHHSDTEPGVSPEPEAPPEPGIVPEAEIDNVNNNNNKNIIDDHSMVIEQSKNEEIKNKFWYLK